MQPSFALRVRPRFDPLAAGGIDLQARIEYDVDARPEDQGHDPEDQEFGEQAQAICEAWQNDEWFYCGIVVTVFYKSIRVADHAASLWGIECNFPGSDNGYLNEVAAELEAIRALGAKALETAKLLKAGLVLTDPVGDA